MNTDSRKRAKTDFEKKIKSMNNAVFEKSMENVRKHRDINFLQRKKEGIKQYQIQIYLPQIFHKTSFSNRNEKKIADTYK